MAVRIYLNNPDFTLNGFSSASYKIRRIYEHIYKLRPERIAFMNELEIIDLIGSDHFKMYTNYLAN